MTRLIDDRPTAILSDSSAGVDGRSETPRPGDAERWLGAFMTISGFIGLIAALALSIEKIETLINPQQSLSCDLSVLVQCSANLNSPIGSVFGFPNPFLGVAGFAVVTTVGVASLATARLARWFWVAINVGIGSALVFVVWLIGQSIYVLGTLCPWCLIVWAVTIPLFVFVTGRNAKDGVFGSSIQRFGIAAWPWLTAVTISGYLVIAVLAQQQLNLLDRLV